MSKTILIIGINSQDGAHLGIFYHKLGYNVIGVVRRLSNISFVHNKIFKEKNFTILRVDYNNTDEIKYILRNILPDMLINLSGESSVSNSFLNPDATYQSIVGFSENLLNIMKSDKKLSAIKSLMISSGEIFGDRSETGPACETSKLSPLSPYAVAKRDLLQMCEEECKSGLVSVATAIPFNHESPLRGSSFLIPKVINYINNLTHSHEPKKLKLGNLSIKRDWGWAPDFCLAMMFILDDDVPDTYVISTGYLNSIENLIQQLFAHRGLNYKEWVIHDEQLIRSSEARETYGSSAKLIRRFGWEHSFLFSDLPVNLFKPIEDHLYDTEKSFHYK